MMWFRRGKGLKMQKWIGFSTLVVAALVLLCQGAQAGGRHEDHRLFFTGLAAGAAGTAAYFALRDWKLHGSAGAKISEGGAMVAGTAVCAALSPIFATVVVKRELTLREAYAMSWDCVIPFVGGWLVNKAFDAHPEWEGKRKRRHR
jgi:hypothetical protein